ncbi:MULTISPECIES: hypothetical protein [Streptomyces]|uniref:Secreted protein n=1 Tax=Streptomyces koelreuteriae TaxID=2838015 RepID=A0ABX8FUH9_9ACTN|nr:MULTISPECIES: hypothetical protein [Streptomyces]QWB24647.1 hypothetical protein KJK29_19820 [Streptomyces koelreuteriae]UUA07658.1 hypothetical protein NNW98_19935 [Streptomyces koelreuteriae]UUA15287.1 hypothetical protein NNW99_19930 [Streptomyces sp. CRCS-T-1]
MHDLIRRTLEWLRLLFCPGTGKRRRLRHRTRLCLHFVVVRHPAVPRAPQLPQHRSPYGLVTPLDGSDSALVRPYLAVRDRHLIAAHEVAA